MDSLFSFTFQMVGFAGPAVLHAALACVPRVARKFFSMYQGYCLQGLLKLNIYKS